MMLAASGAVVLVTTQFLRSGYVYLDAAVAHPVGGLVLGLFLLATAAAIGARAAQRYGLKVLSGLAAAGLAVGCLLAGLLLVLTLLLSRDARTTEAVLATSPDGRLVVAEQRYSKQGEWVSVLRLRSRDGIASRLVDLECITWHGDTGTDNPFTSARFVAPGAVVARTESGGLYRLSFDPDSVTAPPADPVGHCGELRWWW